MSFPKWVSVECAQCPAMASLHCTNSQQDGKGSPNLRITDLPFLFRQILSFLLEMNCQFLEQSNVRVVWSHDVGTSAFPAE